MYFRKGSKKEDWSNGKYLGSEGSKIGVTGLLWKFGAMLRARVGVD